MSGVDDPTGGAWEERSVPAHTPWWSRPLRDLRDLVRAREELRDRLRSAGLVDPSGPGTALSEAAERLLLAADEMTSNAIRHGNPPVAVGLAAVERPDHYLLTVTDQAPSTAPAPDPGRDPVDGGLGLFIIATYAVEHGWWPEGGTKTVWAVLPTTA